MTPDPSGLYFASKGNPQSLNLYSYALNNPLKYTDPNGLFCYYGDTGGGAQEDADNGDKSQWDYHSSQSECETADANGNKGQWTNDSETHQTGSGDWADNDNRDENYTIGSTFGQVPKSGSPMIDPTDQVIANVNSIRNNPSMSKNLAAVVGFLPRNRIPIPGNGTYDYKSFPGGSAQFGNFNYGAMCRAAELSLQQCQQGAGAAAIIFSPQPGPGTPFGAGYDNWSHLPDYGDQKGANENGAVVSGWSWADWREH